ncbi:MAG: DNA polymerase I [Candidatus Muiribacteriota bacterium]
MKKLVVIDGHSLLYRAYFAFIRSPLYNSKGQNTSAIYGFLNMFFKITQDFKPDCMVIVQDKVRGGFRMNIYPEYKAHRDETPEELKSQFEIFNRLLKTMNIPTMSDENYEGDDIIGSLCNEFGHNHEVYIVSGDKDNLQLLDISPNIKMIMTKKGISEIKVYDRNNFKEEFGFEPLKIIDYKALTGDKSDNIPGVKGVGDKTAKKLISEFGSLENIYKNIDSIKGAVQKKLVNNKENAFLSQKLAEISLEYKTNLKDEDLCYSEKFGQEFAELMTELEFKKFLEKFGLLPQKPEKTKDENIETVYKKISSRKELDEVFKKAQKASKIAFDTETTSLSIHELKLVGFSISFKPGEAYYIPVNHFYLGMENEYQEDINYLMKKIQKLFEKVKNTVAHNIKFDFLVLKKCGIEVPLSFDTSIAHYLLEPDKSHGISKLARQYFDIDMTPFKELAGKNGVISQVQIDEVTPYACADADICFRLNEKLAPELKEKNLEKLFHEVEMPLVETIAHMEWHGIKLNKKYLKELYDKYSIKQKKLEEEIFEIAGEEFNLDSPKQLSNILFNKLRIKPVKKTKTGYSTNVVVLETLASKNIKIAEKLIQYRNYSKLLNTYIIPLPKLTDKNDFLHASFNQTVTTTGRLSSSNPNLQNIPVKSEEGNAIRKAFRADDGKIFLSFDYSQIELRVLAHITGDAELIEAFNNGKDVHTLTASGVFKVKFDEVTPEMRRMAKVVNFGLIYGMNAYGLASRLGISNKEAETYIRNFFAKYSSVKKYNDDIIIQAKKDKYVKTIFGRKRNVAGMNKQMLARMAVNTPIQGSAADIIKIAMIEVYKKLNLSFEKNSECKMLVQIHDELVFEIPDNEQKIKFYTDEIKDIMENSVKLKVPLKINAAAGHNLGELIFNKK